MLFLIAADAVSVIHLAFIIFAVLGGLLVLRWKRLAWFHVPSFCWATAIEFLGAICPLTPMENWLRMKGDDAGYDTGFIEQYLLPIMYPEALTREIQIYLGIFVLTVNLIIYGWLPLRRWKEKQKM